MATSQRLGVGYLGWSWSGNGGGVEYLDMATGFDATKLTTWGKRLIDGANGIRATSKESPVYGGGGGDTQAPTAPGTPAASAITSTGARLTWAAATDDTGVTAYDVVRVTAAGESAVTTVAGTSADLTGLTPPTQYGFAVYARDAAGNRSPRSGTATLTTAGGGTDPAGACSVRYVLSDWGSSFNGDVTVRNTGTTAVDGWALDFAFPGPQQLNSVWNAKGTQSGRNVHATDEAWTRTIPARGSVTFGFNASSVPGTNGVPAAFTLNGASCSTG
ncbi:cellulose binding domain-containing protein [Kitasatospora sp. NPDC051914]|uniref:cellulose binding domain-containing protein n=1 Tax=Kitasatospora sp. NPDC051914 TaxID=3154945 RepID=UPI003433CC71